MKRLILCAILVCVKLAGSQNKPPEVENISVQVYGEQNRVEVFYDLLDEEQDSVKVSFKVSGDCGETFLFSVDSISGDVGFPILPGAQKQLMWHYDPSNIDFSALSSNCFQVKIIADDLQEIDIRKIVDEVDSTRMRDDLLQIEGVRHFSAGLSKLEETKDFIEMQFVQQGLQASRHSFDYRGYQATNVIGKLAGNKNEEKAYVIDAHFDTVPTAPGADDNGSGTIGMIEAMRILSQYNFDNSIKFVGFDVEEVGIIGSRHYVAEAIPAYEQIEGVFNFEMIGFLCKQAVCQSWLAAGDYIVIMYNTNSTRLFQSFQTHTGEYVPELRIVHLPVTGNGENDQNARRSDHMRFWDAGIQALFMTDGANFRNPNYHRPSDRVETLDFNFFTKVVKATVATVAELAGIQHSGVGLSSTFDLITGIEGAKDVLPKKIVLAQNYPNPFNPSTTIRYTLQKPSLVVLEIYNVLGTRITTLFHGTQNAGSKLLVWDGRNQQGQFVASGVYLYKITVGNSVEVRKMTFLR